MQTTFSDSSDSLLGRDDAMDDKKQFLEQDDNKSVGTASLVNYVRILLAKSDSGTLYQREDTGEILYTTLNVRSWKRWDAKSFYRGERGPSSVPFATSKNFTVDIEDPVRGGMANISENDILYRKSKLSLHNIVCSDGQEYKFRAWPFLGADIKVHRIEEDKDSLPLAVFSRKDVGLPKVKGVIKVDASSIVIDDKAQTSRAILIRNGKPTPAFDAILLGEYLFRRNRARRNYAAMSGGGGGA